MATAKIVTGGHPNADGLVPIYIRVRHNGKKTEVPISGLKISSDNFDEVKFILKSEPTVLNYQKTNERLMYYHLTAVQTINRLAADNAIISIDIIDLVNAISLACFNVSTMNVFSFGSYTDSIIAQLTLSKKFGNAKCYVQAKEFILRRFGRDIQFSELTNQVLKKMEAAHYADGFSKNGLAFFMRTIRAIYNRAVKDKLVSREFNPFITYQIKHEATAKRAISVDEFIKVKELVYDSKKSEFHAHKYFLFSFYMCGMNFSDIAYLKVSNIVGNRLEYKRVKTGKLYSIVIVPQAKEILDYYLKDKLAADFIFPIIKRTSDADQYADVMSQRRFTNQLLKRIAKSANVNGRITSYVARHSWATIAYYNNVPVPVISEKMGHSDVSTTQIYLKSFPNEVSDMAGLAIANLLDKKSE